MEAATELADALGEHGIKVPTDELAETIQGLKTEFSVPEHEAQRTAAHQAVREANKQIDDEENEKDFDAVMATLRGEAPNDTGFDSLADINKDSQWLDLRLRYLADWDPRHEAMVQVGLATDGDRTVKVVNWESSGIDERLEEGETYELQNLVTDEYNGNYSVKINKQTELEHVTDEAEQVGEPTNELRLPVVAIQSGSGLIKRCPRGDCSRPLNEGRCADHGAVEGEFDLRIKAIMDDGQEAHTVFFDAEATEAISGVSLDEAKEMAMDALDTEVVAERIRDEVIGRYVSIEVSEVYGNWVVEDVLGVMDAPDMEERDAVLARARSFMPDDVPSPEEVATGEDKEATA